tara:strand:+ start:277 stop:495 length:219 start_codon:yes stop_codon:yes gene_type:complete
LDRKDAPELLDFRKTSLIMVKQMIAPSAAFSSFNPGEFIKVPKKHPGIFYAYMNSELFNYIQNSENRCFVPD